MKHPASLALCLCLLPLSSCKKEVAPPPAPAAVTKSQAEAALYQLHKDMPSSTRPISNVRTSTTASPSFYAELKGSWYDDEAGPYKEAHYTINAFFKDGKWYYDPKGSTAKFLGVAEPESTRKACTYLNTIAYTLKLEE